MRAGAHFTCPGSLYRILQQQGGKFVRRGASLFTPENKRADRFYALRAEFSREGDPERCAALFVYLNRHCCNLNLKIRRSLPSEIPPLSTLR
jgi:site-specific DNA-adenine methylase